MGVAGGYKTLIDDECRIIEPRFQIPHAPLYGSLPLRQGVLASCSKFSSAPLNGAYAFSDG